MRVPGLHPEAGGTAVDITEADRRAGFFGQRSRFDGFGVGGSERRGDGHGGKFCGGDGAVEGLDRAEDGDAFI